MDKVTSVDTYRQRLEGEQLAWIDFFVTYMRNHHPDLEECISFQMPTYKLGSGKARNYVSFHVAKHHFSLHSMDFEAIAYWRTQLKKPGKGKGCVQVPYTNIEERAILCQAIENIIEREVYTIYGKKTC
ncbi:MAG: DUF1801 domain-containing protein [Erysipelotrichaceae bacterium]